MVQAYSKEGEKMKKAKKVFCPYCSCSIAPFDPEKVIVGDREYHGSCWARQKREEKELNDKYGKAKVIPMPVRTFKVGG